MSGILLSVGVGIIFLSGWNSANLFLEYQKKVEDERTIASKNVAVYSRARVLNRFPVDGDE